MAGRSETRRYLSFEPDIGGFNNILMHLEIMVVLAWVTQRTLVLPPPRPFYLLGDEPRSLLDFFDEGALQAHLDIVTAEELDPGWDVHSPAWNAVEDALALPASALTDRLELIPRLHGRRCISLTAEEEECRILHFPASEKHRMFGVFDAFFLFADPEKERRARALVRDAIQYRPEILRLADRAAAAAALSGEPYSSMHVRRGDFQYTKTRTPAAAILRHTANLVEHGQVLYLATDETDAEFLLPFQERYRVVRFQDLCPDVVARTPSHWIGIVETLICAIAPGRFVGTRLSTFSARIATVRGHLSCGAGPHGGIDTALYYTQPPLWAVRPDESEPYGVPLRKHDDEHGETATPWWISVKREPIWGRAYRAVWAEAAAQA